MAMNVPLTDRQTDRQEGHLVKQSERLCLFLAAPSGSTLPAERRRGGERGGGEGRLSL